MKRYSELSIATKMIIGLLITGSIFSFVINLVWYKISEHNLFKEITESERLILEKQTFNANYKLQHNLETDLKRDFAWYSALNERNIYITSNDKVLYSNNPNLVGKKIDVTGDIVLKKDFLIKEEAFSPSKKYQIIIERFIEEDISGLFQSFIRTYFIVWGQVVLFSLTAYFLMKYLFLRKLENINEIIKKDIREKTLSSLPSTGSTDELETLVNSHNKLLEKLLEKQQNLEEKVVKEKELSRVKSSFLAQMSHEIRTPMNAIYGAAQVLEETDLNEKQRTFVHMFKEATSNLLTVINDLLDLSKIEANKLQIISEPFSLYELVQNIVQIFSFEAERKGIELKFEMDEDSKKKYYLGDKGRISQIISNLLSNALKFTSDGHVRLEVLENNGQFEIAIEDTGKGIQKDKLDFIFGDFNQEDLSITRKYGGTGLGLSISKKLAKAMGGDIVVKSELRKGSRFSLFLKLKNIEPPKRSGVNSLNKQKKGARILVVDDSEDNRHLIQAFFHGVDYDLEYAVNGVQAVEMFQANTYDLILMDIEMPFMDGRTATKKIREIEKVNHQERIPIIALTAHALKEQVDLCLEVGCDAHIAKPVNRELLLNTVASRLFAS